METSNATVPDRFTCRLCNKAGTDSCYDNQKCICKPWYEGDQCQNCRFSNEYVLAPNGTCVPCPCGNRPIHECFQSKMCTTHANVAFREATAASSLFIATLAAVLLVGVYLIFRIIKRTKRLRNVVSCRRTYRDDEFAESEAGHNCSVVDILDDSIWKDDQRLINSGDRSRRSLLTPVSDRSSDTSLFYIPAATSPTPTSLQLLSGSKSVQSFLGNKVKRAKKSNQANAVWDNASSTPSVLLSVDNVGARFDNSEFDDTYPKSAMKISSSCSEYYFLSVQQNADDDDEEEQEI